jgi:hypothetical protein
MHKGTWLIVLVSLVDVFMARGVFYPAIIVGRLRHTRSYVMHRAGLLVCEWSYRDSESILKVGEFLQRKEAVEHCH